jgi:hypothetical protein
MRKTRFTEEQMVAPRGASGRNDANAGGEWLRHHELAVRDLEWKCRQGARGGAIYHRSALARIIMRIVAGAFENPLLRDPYTDLAAGMRADRRIGDHALRRPLLRDADQRRRIEPDQEHLVEARATANDIGRRSIGQPAPAGRLQECPWAQVASDVHLRWRPARPLLWAARQPVPPRPGRRQRAQGQGPM